MSDRISGKQMCETIVKADFLRKEDGNTPTAEEIWTYSTTGELSMVFEWYQRALSILGKSDIEIIQEPKKPTPEPCDIAFCGNCFSNDPDHGICTDMKKL